MIECDWREGVTDRETKKYDTLRDYKTECDFDKTKVGLLELRWSGGVVVGS
jgi:hypothetical protein